LAAQPAQQQPLAETKRARRAAGARLDDLARRRERLFKARPPGRLVCLAERARRLVGERELKTADDGMLRETHTPTPRFRRTSARRLARGELALQRHRTQRVLEPAARKRQIGRLPREAVDDGERLGTAVLCRCRQGAPEPDRREDGAHVRAPFLSRKESIAE